MQVKCPQPHFQLPLPQQPNHFLQSNPLFSTGTAIISPQKHPPSLTFSLFPLTTWQLQVLYMEISSFDLFPVCVCLSLSLSVSFSLSSFHYDIKQQTGSQSCGCVTQLGGSTHLRYLGSFFLSTQGLPTVLWAFSKCLQSPPSIPGTFSWVAPGILGIQAPIGIFPYAQPLPKGASLPQPALALKGPCPHCSSVSVRGR